MRPSQEKRSLPKGTLFLVQNERNNHVNRSAERLVTKIRHRDPAVSFAITSMRDLRSVTDASDKNAKPMKNAPHGAFFI